MSVAVSVATRSGLSAAVVSDLARAAERAGMSAFHLAESASDAFALCQAALAGTDTIPVGTAIANARLRHPAAVAMTTAILDELSGGRFRLGLGVSNPAYNEGRLGMPPVRPVDFMRGYVADVRRALAGPLDRRPARPAHPIALAAMQPRMLRLAGEIADGVVLSLTTPMTLPVMLAEVARGAHRAGRPVDAVAVACVIPCCFHDDAEAAHRAGRNVVLGYARHPAAARIFAAHGFADRLPPVITALGRGDGEAAHRLIDPALVEDFVVVDPARCAERVARYTAAGVDQPILFPVPAFGEWEAVLRRTIELAPDICSATTSSERVLT